MIRKQISIPLIRSVFGYLSDRLGYVQIGEARSCVRDIKLGCVQGSILGPFLFNLYTSELSKIVSPWQAVAYADDAYVIVTGGDENEVVENFKETMIKHDDWLKSIGMITNRTKTEAVIFGDSNLKEVEVEGEKIELVKSMKMLGIWVDHDLSWTTQVEKIISKCRSLSYAIKYLTRYLNRAEMRKIFLCHFVGRLTFGCPVWFFPTSQALKNKVRSVYYRQIRIILKDYRLNLNRNGLAQSLEVPGLDQVMFNRLSSFVFSIINNQLPTFLFETLLSRAYYNERNDGKVVFFRDSRSRVNKANIVTMAHAVSQKWNFAWLHLTKEEFKKKIIETKMQSYF